MSTCDGMIGNCLTRRRNSGGIATTFSPALDVAHSSQRGSSGRSLVATGKQCTVSHGTNPSWDDSVGGPPPARRLTAFSVGEGNSSPLSRFTIRWTFLNCGKDARPPRANGVSRRDGGAPTASFRLRLPCHRFALILFLAALFTPSTFHLVAGTNDAPTIAERTPPTYPVHGAQRIKRKLSEIVLPTIHFDAVPLAEVVKRLSEDAKKFDPEKKGLNFLIYDPVEVSPLANTTTNTTPPLRPASLSEGLIHVRQPLTGLTLRHALEVICRSAEVPTHFYIEEYAVTFFPRQPAGVFSRTLRANPDTFRQGLPGVVSGTAQGAIVGGNSTGAGGRN